MTTITTRMGKAFIIYCSALAYVRTARPERRATALQAPTPKLSAPPSRQHTLPPLLLQAVDRRRRPLGAQNRR